MLWIRVASDFTDSPKIGTLARALRVNRDAALARIVTLWGWAARHAPTGNLEGVPDAEIAQGAKWRGRPDRFVAGLQAARLLDGRQIHDWERMNGRFIRECSRVKTWKERQRLQRENAEAVTRNGTRNVTDERNGTGRCSVLPAEERGQPPALSDRSLKSPTAEAVGRLAPALRMKGVPERQIARYSGMLKTINGDPVAVLAAALDSIAKTDPPAYAVKVLQNGGPSDDARAEASGGPPF